MTPGSIGPAADPGPTASWNRGAWLGAPLRALTAGAILCSVLTAGSVSTAALELSVDAPPSFARIARRIEAIDSEQLTDALARAGLALPPKVHVTLLPEDDPRARATPRWIVGLALAPRDIVIFPARGISYPYDSTEAVVRHEMVHLALAARADPRPLPRWFHEGVAVSVESGWSTLDQIRLLFAMAGAPPIEEVESLFLSSRQQQTTLAYLLAAALVDDLRQRHGATLPGAIAGRVGTGTVFEQAFVLEAGETPGLAAARAWAGYWRWTNWIPAMTSTSTLWLAILLVAALAFVVRRLRATRLRRQWADEDGEWPDG